jgi:hypothetical protein
MIARPDGGTSFLCVDLDIEASVDLTLLADAMDGPTLAMSSTREGAVSRLTLELVPEAEASHA